MKEIVLSNRFAPTGESRFISASDGTQIHVRFYHANRRALHKGVPVVCLPGLSRNGRDFDLLARALSGAEKHAHDVYCIDFRGRGLSGYDKDWRNYTILTEAEDVISVLAALNVEHALFVGTSRGGLVTMILSAIRPGLIKATVLNDIGPVIEGDGLTQIRLYLQREQTPGDWAQAAAMQRALMGKTFTQMSQTDWEREAHARFREIDGAIKPDYDPQLVKTLTGIDLATRLPTMWAQYGGLAKIPLLVIRGENSTLLSSKTVDEMSARHPNMQLVIAKNQGHAPFLAGDSLIGAIGHFAAGLGH